MTSFFPPRFSIGLHYRINWPKLFTKQEIDEFIELYERSNTSEQELHDFLKSQPKFLYALGAYEAAVSEVSIPSGIKDADGEMIRLRLDFLLQDSNGLWDVVELKKADFGDLSLIVGLPQRRRFAAVVDSAVVQVKTYLRELDRAEARESLSRSNIVVVEPQAWLIIGREKDVPIRERRLIERDLPRNLRIVTYDDLCNLAKQRALIVTPEMLLPYFRSDDTEVRAQEELLTENLLGPEQSVLFRPGQRRVERARDFLKEHFAEKIRVSQLAEISGLTQYHFQLAFKREFGLSPHTYQTSVRIEKVQELLKSGRPASEAASEVGFSDQSHLIRHFKKLVGVTPAKYASMVTSETRVGTGGDETT